MRRECRERFYRHRLQRKPLISDPDMHHLTCVTHVPWCMSGSLTRGGGEDVPGIPGACATRYFTYLVRGPLQMHITDNSPVNVKGRSLGFINHIFHISIGSWQICERNENAIRDYLFFKCFPNLMMMKWWWPQSIVCFPETLRQTHLTYLL